MYYLFIFPTCQKGSISCCILLDKIVYRKRISKKVAYIIQYYGVLWMSIDIFFNTLKAIIINEMNILYLITYKWCIQ